MMFSGLRKVTNVRVNEELRASESEKKKPQSKYPEEDRFKIAKCATHDAYRKQRRFLRDNFQQFVS